MNDIMHKDWHAALTPIMKRAGEILLSFWRSPLEITMKDGHGFATNADYASEAYLSKALADLLPEASLYGEENGKSGPDHADFEWVIDPLDGTTNFAHGLPYFCVSVALTYQDEPVVAAIYQPVSDELFFAQKGSGALCNGVQMQVSDASLSTGLLACSLPYRKRGQKAMLEQIDAVISTAYSIRHFGAAALDMAHVAAGRVDGLLLKGLAWWDVAAGALLIAEAGGQVSDFVGKPLRPDYTDCVAGGAQICSQLMALFD